MQVSQRTGTGAAVHRVSEWRYNLRVLAAGEIAADRYRLESRIGEGAMGEVWRAFDQLLQRSVAVKFLSIVGLGDGEAAVARFLREARIAASVQHRNVIQTVDFGTLEDDRPYMVMELLQGQSLATRLEQPRPLAMEELVGILGMTLRGLCAVHDAGIVHRDLKPANIFLHQDPEGVLPKILDFGISRSLGVGDRRSALSTQQGLIVGTPDYMSPEQARGQGDIDKRADIYAMGVILYEGLSGQVPFKAETVGELIAAIIQERPTPIRELRPEVPPLLASVIEQAMWPAREHRFVDARVMHAALTAAGAELSQTPAAPGGRRRLAPGDVDAPLSASVLGSPDRHRPSRAGGGASGGWGSFEGLSVAPSPVPASATRAKGGAVLEAAMRASAPPVSLPHVSPQSLGPTRPSGGRAVPSPALPSSSTRSLGPPAANGSGALATFDESDLGGPGGEVAQLEIDYRRGTDARRPKRRASRGSNPGPHRPTPVQAALRPRQRRRQRRQVILLVVAIVGLVLVGPALVIALLARPEGSVATPRSPVGPDRAAAAGLSPLPPQVLSDRLKTHRRRAPGRHRPALRDLMPD